VASCAYRGEVMLTDGRYKACYTEQAESYLLFDLAEDPDEARNRVGDPALAGVQARLDRELMRHLLRHQIQEAGPRLYWWQIEGRERPEG